MSQAIYPCATQDEDPFICQPEPAADIAARDDIRWIKQALEQQAARFGLDLGKLTIDHDGEGEFTLVIPACGGISTGEKIDHPIATRPIMGFRAWVLRETPGSRWVPPDTWDETIYRGSSPAEAVKELVVTLLRLEVDAVFERMSPCAE